MMESTGVRDHIKNIQIMKSIKVKGHLRNICIHVYTSDD